jgi:hypothetical protein
VIVTVETRVLGRAPTVKARCPSCGRLGTFDDVGVNDLQPGEGWWLGQRVCPNDGCKAHVFFVMKGQNLLATYPPQRIDFDRENIPQEVLNVFGEAITCHAEGCYVASAIMIRRTLEELCRERGAEGKGLKKRIEALASRIVLPKELLDGMDDLRLLGNDAAHIEARDFEKVSQDEVEVAIEFTKEILKAAYQYENLLRKLRELKKSGPEAAEAGTS